MTTGACCPISCRYEHICLVHFPPEKNRHGIWDLVSSRDGAGAVEALGDGFDSAVCEKRQPSPCRQQPWAKNLQCTDVNGKLIESRRMSECLLMVWWLKMRVLKKDGVRSSGTKRPRKGQIVLSVFSILSTSCILWRHFPGWWPFFPIGHESGSKRRCILTYPQDTT